MRPKFLLISTLLLAFTLLSGQANAGEPSVLKTKKERESYAVGVDLARHFQRQGIDSETDMLLKGMRDALSRSTLLMTEEELQAALNDFQTEVKQKRARPLRYVAEDNRRKGEAFMAANKAKEGVVTLPSGLQYKILKEDIGAKPTEADTVEIRYRGTFIDGTEFDSSYRRGQSTAVKVSGVIPGWKEALKLMPSGSKWQLFIPPELAYGSKGHTYGARGSDRIVGPNETLIFELELVAVK